MQKQKLKLGGKCPFTVSAITYARLSTLISVTHQNTSQKKLNKNYLFNQNNKAHT